jgi:nitrous oxidase accessory protein NosD
MRCIVSAVLSFSLVLVLSLPAGAATQVLPGAAHTAGLNDTMWVTDLRLLNPGEAPVEVDLLYTPYDGGEPLATSLTLLSGELAQLDDVVATTFAASGSGFITVTSAEPVVTGQRTYNLTTAGTFGQYVPAAEAVEGKAYLTGLRGGTYRTNLGLVNPSVEANQVAVSIATGKSRTLAPGAAVQLARIERWQGFFPEGDSGMVTPSAEMVCYASVVDNRTGDPSYVPGLQPSIRGVLAGLAHSPGAHGTIWRSDLYLYAPDYLRVTGTLVFYGEDGKTATSSFDQEMGFGQTLLLEDVIAQLAPGRDGTGLLWIEATRPVVAAARTYNLASSGTFGQTVLPVAPDRHVQPGRVGLFLFAARDATGTLGYRSNLALINPEAVEAAYLVELLDNTGGVLASRTLTVPPRSGFQKNQVLRWLGQQSVEDGVIRVSGSAPFSGYLSSVDNRTGDGITVTPVAFPPSKTEVTYCGQVVVKDAVLVDDLVCDTGVFESVAVSVAASNITLDLGGHVISGHPIGIGVHAQDVEGVTIKNGTIESFLVGMDVVGSREVTVEDLTIRNLEEDDPDNFLPGLRITRSQEVLVRDSFFEFLPVAHKEAIVLANSEVTVDNIEMKDGSVGVNISSDGNEENIGSDVSVINSLFVGVTIAGVLVQWTDNARVADNEFTSCEVGVSVDTHTPGGITGLTIEDNSIDGGHIGVHFMGTSDSSILNNVIRNMWRGIFLDANMDCPDSSPGPECFYATDNVISGNQVTGNFIDLYHHEYAVGNTWENNICQTKEGAEIPACTAKDQ